MEHFAIRHFFCLLFLQIQSKFQLQRGLSLFWFLQVFDILGLLTSDCVCQNVDAEVTEDRTGLDGPVPESLPVFSTGLFL